MTAGMKGLLVAAERRPAGAGSRLRQLAEVGNKSLLVHAMDAAAEVGIREVCIVTTPDAIVDVERAIGDGDRFGVQATCVTLPHPVGALEALLACREQLGDSNVLVHPCDTLRSATIPLAVERFAGERLDAMMIVAPSGRAGSSARVVVPGGLRLGASTLTGVHIFGPRMLDAAAAIAPADDGSLRLDDAIEWLTENGGRVGLHETDQWWAYGGDLDDLLEGNRALLDSLQPDFQRADLTDTRVQGRVSIHPTASVDATTIRGPALIGARAEIRDAYIGPYTSIGADVHISGAELEYSIVLAGARLENVGRRIEASVIGANAHITSDFSLPKALRVRVGDNAELRVV